MAVQPPVWTISTVFIVYHVLLAVHLLSTFYTLWQHTIDLYSMSYWRCSCAQENRAPGLAAVSGTLIPELRPLPTRHSLARTSERSLEGLETLWAR